MMAIDVEEMRYMEEDLGFKRILESPDAIENY
jgi:hypothetical protein